MWALTQLGVEAAEQARRDVAVIISSETALAYVDLRGAQKRLQVARDNANTQAQSLELLNALLDNGRATALDINRADAQYRTTLAQLPIFQAIIDGAVSRLAVLTGSSASQPPSSITGLGQSPRAIPALSAAVTLGSPADLIRRRPDIRAAETEIARRLALGEADIDISDAETERAYKIYERTVLQALADVEVALANLINERQRQADLERAVASARGAVELAQLRFDEGVDDFLDVLDAQRTLLDSEDRLAQNELQTTRLAVLTYRELGGF